MYSTSSTLTVKALCPSPVEDGRKAASVLHHPRHCPQLLWAKDVQGNASPMFWRRKALLLGLAGLKASCRQLE